MLELYGGNLSRASIVRWYLEELELPYEYIRLDLRAEEHKQAKFLSINPMGRVPALIDDSFQVWESGAILLYLCEKYGNESLCIPDRTILNQWILFGNSTLSSAILVKENLLKEAPELLTALNRILAKQPFLTGDRFTVADVAVGSILAYIPIVMKMDVSAYPEVVEETKQLMSSIDLNIYPALHGYVKRLASRSPFQKTIGLAQ